MNAYPFSRFLLPLFIFAISSLLAGQPERADQVGQSLRGDLIEEGTPLWSIVDRMNTYNTPGASLAIVEDFELAAAKSFGLISARGNGRITTDTRFQAASISKVVNAVGVMRLVEEGVLDLDQDVNELLQSWQIPKSAKYPDAVITPRMLLAHIAGLSAHGFGGYATGEGLPNPVDILDKAKDVNSDRVRIIKEPGKSFKYSGGGTTILQVLVEDLTGKAYPAYIQGAVFQPLGMTNSFYSVNQKGKEDQLATAHFANGKPLKNKYQHYPESAAAGVWTTPTDLSKLMIDLMLSMRGDADHLLKPATVQDMITPSVEGENNALGLFIRKRGNQVFFEHGGSNEGFKAQFIGNIKTGQGAIVMTNGEQYDLVPEVINAVATVFEWADWFGPESTVPKDLMIDKKQWKIYSGSYLSTSDQPTTLDISVKKGRLMASRPKAFSFQLIPITPTKYLAKGASPTVTVEFMPDGTMQVKQAEVVVFRKQ